jgi:YidC/Oxa1 family membrane protein insertase
MPILFALYGVLGLGNAKSGPGLMIKHLIATHEIGTFYALVPDISKTPKMIWTLHGFSAELIPYLLLVLIFGVSIWLPQALMPGDKQQKQIGAFMAVFMLYFGWMSPAGVLLYWDVSSIWGVAQQQITMSITKRELAADQLASAPESKKKGAASTKDAVSAKKPSNKAPKKG